MPDPDDAPGPAAGPLPRPEPERLPGGRLLRRRPPMPYATATSPHSGGVPVHRGTFSAVVLAGNRPAGAIWLDPGGLWRTAPVGAAALAVSGPEPDDGSRGPVRRPWRRRRPPGASPWVANRHTST